MDRQEFLRRVDGISVWKRADERAPHKPLLLLYALAHAAHGDRELRYTQVDEVLKDLLREFGPKRSSYHPEFPFWYLQSDGLWEVPAAASFARKGRNKNPPRSVLLTADAVGRLPEQIYEALQRDTDLLHEVAHRLLEGHFPDSLHDEILSAVGLSLEADAGKRRRRDPAFRARVLRAYEHQCAICGFQARLGDADVGLEAAHIRWHQAGGADDEPNGLALCVMHHKLFDRGAMTVAVEDLTVRVSQEVHGGSGFTEWVMGFHGQAIRPAQHPHYYPSPGNLAWHWKEVFRRPPRFVD